MESMPCCRAPGPTPFQNFSVSKATVTGKATLVAISPDGKYLLHVMEEGGQQSLWLQNIPTNSNTQVVAPAPVEYQGLRFSPDGNYLYFIRLEPGSRSLKYLYRAPVLGGTPQKLVTDIDSNVSFSPDGQRFAYLLGNNPKPGEYRLIIRSVEGERGKNPHIRSPERIAIRCGVVSRRQDHRHATLAARRCARRHGCNRRGNRQA